METHSKLTDEGWVRRFTAEEPRVSEMKQVYESMGLEVLIVEGFPEESQQCTSCFDVEEFAHRYKTIYTKGDQTVGQRPDDDLFD